MAAYTSDLWIALVYFIGFTGFPKMFPSGTLIAELCEKHLAQPERMMVYRGLTRT